MTAEIEPFPHDQSHVIKSLMRTARRVKEDSPEQCIEILSKVIALMALEWKRSHYAAVATQSVLDSLEHSSDG